MVVWYGMVYGIVSYDVVYGMLCCMVRYGRYGSVQIVLSVCTYTRLAVWKFMQNYTKSLDNLHTYQMTKTDKSTRADVE